MRVIMCDDDSVFLKYFSQKLISIFKKRNTQVETIYVNSGIDALREITIHPADVLFLDIDMPEIHGFSVAKEISTMQRHPLIIFLSNLEHLVYQSFVFQPFWFLRKSTLEDLPMVVDKILQVLSEKELDYMVFTNGKNIRIPISDILYFESESHYLCLHLKDEMIRFKGRISDVENDLKNHAFVRCHVGYLVNCRFIQIVDRKDLVLMSGKKIPISRTKADETQQAFMAYMGSLRL